MKNTPRSLTAFAWLLALALAPLSWAQTPAVPAKFDEKNAAPYKITRGDVLAVAVFGEAQLTIGGKKVESRGTINLPLIGDVRVVGMNVGEAKLAIENAYKDGRFLRSPEVTVSLEGYAQRVVIINGRVNQPGKHELPPDAQMTLKDLIAKAGGFGETAKGTEVRVLRTMPDGSLKTFYKDVESFLRGRSNANVADANFVLEPDDVVYVPEKLI